MLFLPVYVTRWGQLADLQSSRMHNQGDQSVNVCLITAPPLPHCPIRSDYWPLLWPPPVKKKKKERNQANNAPHSCWLLSTECILVPSSTPQPHKQAPIHTCPLFPKACHKGAAISQPLWQDAAPLTKTSFLLSSYDTCTDTQNHVWQTPCSLSLHQQNTLGQVRHPPPQCGKRPND